MHVILCEYSVCATVLLKIDVFKNVLCTCPVSEDRYYTVGHPIVRMAHQGTFPQLFERGVLLNKSQMNLAPILLIYRLANPLYFY
jgi:hypothetical protein